MFAAVTQSARCRMKFKLRNSPNFAAWIETSIQTRFRRFLFYQSNHKWRQVDFVAHFWANSILIKKRRRWIGIVGKFSSGIRAFWWAAKSDFQIQIKPNGTHSPILQTQTIKQTDHNRQAWLTTFGNVDDSLLQTVSRSLRNDNTGDFRKARETFTFLSADNSASARLVTLNFTRFTEATRTAVASENKSWLEYSLEYLLRCRCRERESNSH